MTALQPRPRLSGDVWWIAFSAFFADLGYQMVLAGLPVFLVLGLGAPAWVLGLAMAVSYGPGALMGWLGGQAGDRWGRKRIAVAGNLAIPLLSLTGLAVTPAAAVSLFSLGWWARNFRSPARRAMVTEVTSGSERARAFGLLHALDVGGGVLAALGVVVLTAHGMPLRQVFIWTLLPLLASTACLLPVAGRRRQAAAPGTTPAPSGARSASPPLYRGILLAAALYGFSSYSLGFPILTVAQGTGHPSLGFLAYAWFLGISALTGLVTGHRPGAGAGWLAGWGYGLAAAGSAALAAGVALGWGLAGYLAAVALLGVALGVIETLEPTLIARLVPAAAAGGGMGSLTAARSLGLFLGNLVMGLLYQAGAGISYSYAAVVAAAAALILLRAARQSPAPGQKPGQSR